MKIKVASFFAGVGGIDLGFKKAGFDIIWANEFDTYPATTYKQNNDSFILVKDIKDVKEKDIPSFDVMIGGFPCQAFSVAGYRKGFEDERGNLFFELERIFKNKKPEIIFLENVKNLETHDNGKTFQIIKEKIQNAGYYVKSQVLNACEYGNIPQNRERIYIVAFKNKKKYEEFNFPKPIKLTHKIEEYIDFDKKVNDKYYYSKLNCKFYEKLEKEIVNERTIYQWRRVYVRANKNNLCPTLTANMGTGGHNVPLIKTEYGIRKLTPRECFNLMGYKKDFILPDDVSDARLYKQAGNSVVVPVIERIAKEIIDVYKGASNK